MITIHFYLRFRSEYGQSFFISGNIPELGNGDQSLAVPIQYLNNEYWHGSIEVAKTSKTFQYNYILKGSDGYETVESSNDRIIDTASIKTTELQVMDTWNYAGEYENAFFTQPFTGTLLQHPQITGKKPKNFTHIFRIKAPLLTPVQTMCLLGSCPELGSWDEEKPVIMALENNWYTVHLNLSENQFPIAYKYGVFDTAAKTFGRYETFSNRTLHGTGKKQTIILHDGFAGLPNNSFKGAGVAIPVFSLRSNNSYGVGEFTDIKLLVDWARSIGMKLVQLLPLNDTTATHTWVDSYPYSAVSAFALHPLFLNLEKLAGAKHVKLLDGIAGQKATLNKLPDVDYEAVMTGKMAFVKKLFAVMKKDWLASSDYQKFYDDNKHWLLPYAVFCKLRDKYNTSEFDNWPEQNSYDASLAEKISSPAHKEFDSVAIHLFLQYQLHLQLQDAVSYAHANGVIMKGDIPIGIYRNSCDAWVEPGLYNMDAQAGAPPDDFAIKGQNWGFPTYNWKRMQQDGFKWWKQRFEQMGNYFDAFRIDHILGFFRIWSIPMHAVEGIMGRFVPCIPVFQSEFGEKGIWFDYNRYCKPFITDNVLNDFFGEYAGLIKEEFLQLNEWGNYAFKPAFDTQRKIEAFFQVETTKEDWLKQKLYDLLSNVILFDDTNNQDVSVAGYHFRIGMMETSSYQYLDDHVKHQLSELYVNYYFRRQDAFWKKEALVKLPALKASTNMLICGEDLGMVPDCVPGVMKDLGLLSLEIQRMPKDPKKKFFHPADAPYMSVVTPSTHDMSTIRGWWEEDRNTTQQFYNNELGRFGEAPVFCEPWINEAIIKQHVFSSAMWSIFQLQDLMGSDGKIRRENPNDERINIPANPKHYWRYRMHISLEELLQETAFNDNLKQLLIAAGRS
ncbi:MAG: 4-alpha-glucanotransferase [Bacteroidota bacterium]